MNPTYSGECSIEGIYRSNAGDGDEDDEMNHHFQTEGTAGDRLFVINLWFEEPAHGQPGVNSISLLPISKIF